MKYLKYYLNITGRYDMSRKLAGLRDDIIQQLCECSALTYYVRQAEKRITDEKLY